jgi:hypothetical protein
MFSFQVILLSELTEMKYAVSSDITPCGSCKYPVSEERSA